MAILLGNYQSKHSENKTTAFYLFTFNSTNYFCIQDIDILFFHGKLNTKTKLLKQILKANSKDFIKHKRLLYVTTRTLIPIARLFNNYCLAELCKLSLDEILGNVAEPLLNNITMEHYKTCSAIFQSNVVERDLVFEPLNGDEWPFIAPLGEDGSTKDTAIATGTCTPTTASTCSPLLSAWLSSDLPNTPLMIHNLISAAKVKRQQQAIIETRQRQTSFAIPTIHHHQKNKPKLIQTKKSDTQPTAITATTLPPSPPNRKRKSFPPPSTSLFTSKKCKQTSSAHHRQFSSNSSSTNRVALPPQPSCYHDNLTLLATQATQMRDLPLSPEVSPSPPPYFPSTLPQQTQRLPSIKTMLSELNYNIDFMKRDSCV